MAESLYANERVNCDSHYEESSSFCVRYAAVQFANCEWLFVLVCARDAGCAVFNYVKICSNSSR